MNLKNKNFLSVLALAGFSLLAIGSKVDQLGCQAMDINSPLSVEERTLDGAELYLNNGEVITAPTLSWKAGALVKDKVKVNNTDYPLDEVRGYQLKGKYYIRHKANFFERIVRGKINVYVHEWWSTETTQQKTGNMVTNRTRTVHRCQFYAQVGSDTAQLQSIANLNEMKALVASCPLAYQMADKKNNRAMNKEVKANPRYVNQIFEIYNNNCKIGKRPLAKTAK